MTRPVSAALILRELWDKSIPVDIENIIKSLSIIIVIKNDLKSDGYADISRDDQREIVINGNHSTLRQRFAMAHELGHHALMHSLPRDGDNIASYGIDYFEIEANNFAAEILIPIEPLSMDISFFTENGLIQVQKLADKYHVSYDAMYYRLKHLGHGQ